MAMSAQGYRMQYADPLDTLDEVDLQTLRDTSMITRRNLAKDTKAVNALDYVLDDRYTPIDHTFESHWYDHLYVGGSYGVEQIKPQADDFKFRTMSQVNLFVGKEFDKKNSLRLSAGGGWGYQRDRNLWLARIQTRLDYLYNLSTHFNGYNPARRMELSLLAGVGANISWMHNTTTEVAPEAHVGLQFKCFTGPLGTINVEPYVGLSGDQIDVSGPRNWRKYDIFYGMNINYAFFLVDNLSKEARLKLLQSRLAGERLVDPQTLEKWRTPWFIEASNGIVMSTSNTIDFSRTVGHQTSLSVGRWLSPIMGFRLSAISRTTRWKEDEVTVGTATDTHLMAYNSHYLSGRVEALFNPLGFAKTFRWDAPWGMYIAFGGEIGLLTKYDSGGKMRHKSESYDLGLHLWHSLSRDLQVFVEPRYTHNVYTVPRDNGAVRTMHGDNNWGIDMGLTMLIRSERYKDHTEMDETQNYIYRDIHGFRVGLAGGISLLQRKGGYFTGSGIDWNGMATLEYRFNHLHTARLHADFININSLLAGRYNDIHTAPDGTEEIRNSGNALWKTTSHVLFTALNYQVSLTNLCSGRLHNRQFELEVYGGPAIGFRLGDSRSIASPVAVDGTTSTLRPAEDYEKKTLFGLDVGMKLSTQVWKGISITLSPTVYLMGSTTSIPGGYTVGNGKMHLYETINLGVQYKIGRLRCNPELLRKKRQQSDARWKARQEQKEREREAQRRARIEKRKSNRKI